jgi:hypothetical protein
MFENYYVIYTFFVIAILGAHPLNFESEKICLVH